MDKKDNPIQVVTIRNTDHRIPHENMGGEAKIFGDGASPERREILTNQAMATSNHFLNEFNQWPGISAVAKVTLKDEALAKSHRPTALFTKSTCPIIGTLDYGEILISVTKEGLTELQDKILNNQSKKPTANISAIEKIEPFSELDRLNGVNASQIDKSASGKTPVKLRLFNHRDPHKNKKLFDALIEFASKNNLSINKLAYGEGLLTATSLHGDNPSTEVLKNFIGLRSITLMPEFKPSDFHLQSSSVCPATDAMCPPPRQDKEYPIVGMFDSGVCPQSTLLKPWIIGHESFVTPDSEDFSHGTMVAGLIANSRSINNSDARFPSAQSKILDINVFPKNESVSELEMILIIKDVVPRYPHIKIWNLSMGGSSPAGQADFSDFSQELDKLHDEFGCLFIIASGNQNDSAQWPTSTTTKEPNRISCPADSIRAISVGSIANIHNANSIVKSEELSPFSRIGPGPCFIPKPEVTHYGGNISTTGSFVQTGILSLGPKNMLCENVGTSFSSPIIASMATQIHFELSQNNTQDIPPERIKALLIHSALVNQTNVTNKNINHIGFGKPGDISDTLYCNPNSITLLFETDVRHGGFEFERFPFPIADCLITNDGKFKGEILMSLVYSPITDKSYASEYCRTNVDVGMGSYDKNSDGVVEFKSKVPAAPTKIKELYEAAQIEHGFKWSPVKAYHKIFPRGINVDTWRLKMKVSRRAEEEKPEFPQHATLLMTIRGLAPEQEVYNQTIQKMNQEGWITTDIDINTRVQTRA